MNKILSSVLFAVALFVSVAAHAEETKQTTTASAEVPVEEQAEATKDANK